MASEKVKLFSKIEVELLASAQGTFTVYTDVPGDSLAQRFQFSVASSIGPGGLDLPRRTVRSRLPYNTQGHLIQCVYKPGFGQTCLYRVRVWARELPGGEWQWYSVPVLDTSIEWTSAELPIPPTPEAWNAVGFSIPPTAEEWRPANFPIPPTPDQWSTVELPIRPTPDVPEWANLEVDR